MSSISKSISTNTQNFRNISDRISYDIGTIFSRESYVKKIEIRFDAFPSFKNENLLLCDDRITKIYNFPTDKDVGEGLDALYLFMRRTSLGYSEMITAILQARQYDHLELTCKVVVIGKATDPSIKYELRDEMSLEAELTDSIWIHAFGSIPPLMK